MRNFLRILCATGFVLFLSTPAVAQDPTGGARILARTCREALGTPCVRNADCTATPPCVNEGKCQCLAAPVILSVNAVKAPPPPKSFDDLLRLDGWILTSAQQTRFRDAFDRISNSLESVTNRQLTISEVKLGQNNGLPSAAIQLVAGTCSNQPTQNCLDNADCSSPGTCKDPTCDLPECETVRLFPTAQIGGWGRGGRIIVGPECLNDPKCFAHEFMHFFGGVRDEYESSPVVAGVATCNASGTPTPSQCRASGPDCIMSYRLNFGSSVDETMCRGGPGGDHETANRTEQSQCNHQSCWDTVAARWADRLAVDGSGLVSATDVPVLDPNPAGVPRAVFVIDRSGSMRDPVSSTDATRKIDKVLTDIRGMLPGLGEGTEVAVVSFGSCVTFPGGPTPPAAASQEYPPSGSGFGPRNIANIEAALNQILHYTNTFDCGTPIAQGVDKAREVFAGNFGTKDQVWILTDGLNTGIPIETAVSTLVTSGVRLSRYCVGDILGGGLESQCQKLGNDASFVSDKAGSKLSDALVDFIGSLEGAGATTGNLSPGSGPLSPASDVVLSGADEQRHVYFTVDPGVDTARFFLAWKSADSTLAATLSPPGGGPLPEAFQSFANSSRLVIYRVPNPAPGLWTLTVGAPALNDQGDKRFVPGEQFTVRGLYDSNRVQLTGGLDQSRVTYPQPFLISLSPSMGLNLTGCSASVEVIKPNGPPEEVALRDDGRGGDAHAGDGFYQAAFDSFTGGSGTYEFFAKLSCPEGARPAIGEFANFTPAKAPRAPAFTRTLRFSGIAEQVPSNLTPKAEICANVEAQCDGVTTPVHLDGTCSTDADLPPGSTLKYQWSSPTVVGNFTPADAAETNASFALGQHEVSLVVTDDKSAPSNSSTKIVTIVDTKGPIVTCHGVRLECTGPTTPVTTHCTAVDKCTPNVPVVSLANSSYAVGSHQYQCMSLDASYNPGTATCTIDIVDTTAPVFSFVPKDLTVTNCSRPDIGQARAQDRCDTDVKPVNDAPAVFALGRTVVTWTAMDDSGNKAVARQVVTAVLADNPTCCPAGTKVILGNDRADVLLGTAGRDCILGRGGSDTINAREGDDLVSGGSGDDVIDSGHGNDLVNGGPGRDTIMGGLGNDVIDGGPDTDVCNAGTGNDQLISCDGSR